MSAMRGRPDATDDVVAWLRAMPAADRERVARLLTDPAAVAAVRAERAAAVVEMLTEPGASWQSVATRMGVGTSVINRMVTAHNNRSRTMMTTSYADLDQATRDALHEQAGHDCSRLTACMHHNGGRPSDVARYADRAELARAEREHGYEAPGQV